MGHCTIKGRSAAKQVFGASSEMLLPMVFANVEAERFCENGWNGQSVRVSLAFLEQPGQLKTLEGPTRTGGTNILPPSHKGPAVNCTTSLPQTPKLPIASMYVQKIPMIRLLLIATRQPHYPRYNAPYNPATTGMGMASKYYAAPHQRPLYQPISPCGLPPAHQCGQPLTPTTATQFPRPNTRPAPAINHNARATNYGTIFISGLAYAHSETKLRSLLKRYGPIMYLEIQPDKRRPDKDSAIARARFRTVHEAHDAVRDLDGAKFMGRYLSVRLVKDDTGSMASGRLVPPIDRRGSTAQPTMQSMKPKLAGKASSTSSHEYSEKTSPTSSKGPLVVDGARHRTSDRDNDSDESDHSDSTDDNSFEESDVGDT
jgi:hypothetical protein